jgi:phthalate 4,5-dioxygenase
MFMLSREDNERLVRVGQGTAMGELFRLFWIPFYLSKDLVADGQPKRIKLLGEDLMLFRDSENRLGLIANSCAHRGAPMMFGRNEACGIRCVYHGWKYDVTGAVTDMPAEPPTSRLKERVRIKAYPCRERNGVVWTYMGPEPRNSPPLPEMEWNLVPSECVVVTLRVQECNRLQALEGELDSAHAPILHGRIDAKGAISDWIAARDLRPMFQCERQDFGVSIAARRRLDNGMLYWRVNQFVMPFYSLVPPQSKFPDLSGHAWVPMDDEHTLCLMLSYHPTEPLPDRTRALSLRATMGARVVMTPTHRRARQPRTRIFGPSTVRTQAFCLTMKVRRRRGFPACPVFGYRTRRARRGWIQSMIAARSTCAPATRAS